MSEWLVRVIESDEQVKIFSTDVWNIDILNSTISWEIEEIINTQVWNNEDNIGNEEKIDFNVNLKQPILDFFEVWNKVFLRWGDENWEWLSDATLSKENILLEWKKIIWTPFEFWWKIFCKWGDENWIWLSDITWDKEIILLEWKNEY